MKKLALLKQRLEEYLFDPTIYIKDRAFVLFSTAQLAALIASMIVGIFLREPLTSTLSSLAIIIVCALLLSYALKYDKIRTAKIVVAFIVVLVFLPVIFFTKGGINCGGPMTLLLGVYYLVLVLDGKFRIVMSVNSLVVIIICWIVGYLKPELVTEYSKESDFIYTFAKLIITWIILTIFITYLTRIYQREATISEEKSRELEELNRSQNRFFSSMSHEIRTPINTVLGLNEIILRQEDASEEIIRDARNIQGAGKLLLALINDILDISKIEAGKMDIVPVNYNIGSLLSEIVNMIWLKAEEKGLKFNVDIDPNVPEILFGDEVRIKQILINLLNNAVKYTKEGSVTLHMECEFPDSEHALLMIQVSDTGMGIKAEALPHLFDSFQRVDEEKNRHIEGTGLGLSIVKQLVELMDGEIAVNSVYNQGSVFTVTLRQAVSSDKRIGNLNITNAGAVSGADKFEHSFHAPDARILIVDDNEMNLQVEKKLLDGTEMKIDLAMSGQEALALTLQNRYDAIFMDHLMPEMDGIECFEKIRSQKGGVNQLTPIIVLTANAGGENIELYNNTGFDGYLVKPVSGALLEDMLLAHLPADKVIGRDREDMEGLSMSTSNRYARKKPVIIATSTMSDLPQNVLRELNISVIPYTLITDEGVFFDTVDVDSEELVRYMKDENKIVMSEPPTVDALTEFFSTELQKAHHLIYITLTTGSSREYGRAQNAARTFDNVTVINSETLSSGTGILVMIAARLAQQNLPVEKIVSELEDAKHLIKTSFVIRSTDVMARRELISTFINKVLTTLWLRPMLRVKNDKLGVGRFLFGSEKQCYEKYIEHAIPAKIQPDTSFAFITYAGMDEEELMWVKSKLDERIRFDHIIFQKASAGISSNCGDGTFGILYILKGDHNYNLGAMFVERDETTDDIDDTDDTDDVADADNVSESPEDETMQAHADSDTIPAKEPKWYENITGIDPKAAIKNSGSEDMLESVLRMFYESFEARSEEIQTFYEQKDWENYTIKVHALKSSSRLVGALALGDAAEALEDAGKRSDIEYITNNHDALMADYRIIKDELAAVFKTDEALPEISPDMLADAYAGLSEFVSARDYELACMVTESLKEYSLPTEDDERFKRINTYLSKMDWDGIKEILSEVL